MDEIFSGCFIIFAFVSVPLSLNALLMSFSRRGKERIDVSRDGKTVIDNVKRNGRGKDSGKRRGGRRGGRGGGMGKKRSEKIYLLVVAEIARLLVTWGGERGEVVPDLERGSCFLLERLEGLVHSLTSSSSISTF